jgi:phospholipase/carboxylesterase/glyoxalase family protein
MTTEDPVAPEYVHRWIPPRAGNARTLLLLHGTGGDENDLVPLGELLDPGAAVLSPRGKVLERGMPRFFRRLSEGVFDVEDLIVRTHELADFVRSAAGRYGFDPRTVVAAGFSNGANIAASMLLLEPGVLSGAILMSPMVPLVPDTLPELDGTPVFIGAGRNDPMVPAPRSRDLAELLERCGADVTLWWHDGGHMLTTEEVRAAAAWLSARARVEG